MKVLLIHPIRSSLGEWERSTVRSFEALGDEVRSIDYRTLFKNKKVNRFIKKIGAFESLLYYTVQKEIKSFRPDMILVSKGERLSERILESVQKEGIPFFNWIGDGMWEFDLIKKIAPYYDAMYTFDTETIRQLSSLGIDNGRYLPFGFDTLLDRTFHPADPEYYRSDIAFVGSPTGERMHLLAYLDKLNIRIKIWGPSGWKDTEYAKYYMGRPIFGPEMYYAYSQAKIVINVHYGFNMESVPYYSGINHRVFESFGIGTYCLSNYQDDMANTFENQLITYHDFNELEKTVPELLSINNPKAIQEEILERHTLLARLNEIKKNL